MSTEQQDVRDGKARARVAARSMVLATVPDFPWAEYTHMARLIEPAYHRIDPPAIKRNLDEALDPLDAAMTRLGATR